MRIVQLANFYGPRSGGLRTALHHLGEGYVARGHTVSLVVPDPRRETALLPGGSTISARADDRASSRWSVGPLGRWADGRRSFISWSSGGLRDGCAAFLGWPDRYASPMWFVAAPPHSIQEL